MVSHQRHQHLWWGSQLAPPLPFARSAGAAVLFPALHRLLGGRGVGVSTLRPHRDEAPGQFATVVGQVVSHGEWVRVVRWWLGDGSGWSEVGMSGDEMGEFLINGVIHDSDYGDWWYLWLIHIFDPSLIVTVDWGNAGLSWLSNQSYFMANDGYLVMVNDG